MNKSPEILSPVGDETMLAAAINAGADAVYFGIRDFSMRATAKCFDLSQLRNITARCHEAGVRAFLTLNTIVYDNELKKLNATIRAAKDAGINAIIAWDMAVVKACLEAGIEVHLSTQASVANFEALKYYADMGIRRIVLARECTLEQIKAIKDRIIAEGMEVELEAFVHGAMCVSVSGRCFLSEFQDCRSANRGDCLQPCRRQYDVVDRESGKTLTLGSNYVLSPKDLCSIGFVDKLIEAGIDCLKIEGRAKAPEYVSTVTSAYRRAVDACLGGTYSPELVAELTSELEQVFNRGLSEGFFMGRPLGEFTDSYGARSNVRKQYVGRIVNYYAKVGVAEVKVEAYPISLGDRVLVQGRTTGSAEATVNSMQIEHEEVSRVEKGNNVGVKFSARVRAGDKVFLLRQQG